jgi:hypothetical protein
VLTASGNAILGRTGSASSMTSGERPAGRGRLNAKAASLVDAWDAQAREAKAKKEREAAEMLEYGRWQGTCALFVSACTACAGVVLFQRCGCAWHVSLALPDAGMQAILKSIDERKYEEAVEAQEVSSTLRATWRMQADRTTRPEWDLNDPDALKKVRLRPSVSSRVVCATT